MCQILCVVLEFFGLFFVVYLAQTQQNNCNLSKVNRKVRIGSMLTCPKLETWISTLNWSKWQNYQFENLYISSHGKARNINIWTMGKHHCKGFIGYSVSGGMISLAHNHVTNLFISSYRGATVIKFGQQKQIRERSRYGTSPLGVRRHYLLITWHW